MFERAYCEEDEEDCDEGDEDVGVSGFGGCAVEGFLCDQADLCGPYAGLFVCAAVSVGACLCEAFQVECALERGFCAVVCGFCDFFDDVVVVCDVSERALCGRALECAADH